MNKERNYIIKLIEEMNDGLWDTSKLVEKLLGSSEDDVKAFYKQVVDQQVGLKIKEQYGVLIEVIGHCLPRQGSECEFDKENKNE